LNRAFIKQQRGRLEALRRQLLGSEQIELEQERILREERGSESQEFEEEAQSMAQQEINQGLRNVNGRRVRAIERALQKIDEGSYGLSDLSGEAISKERLEATPEATLTADEEQLREVREQRGD
jgi:DnaK suppressor protein